MTITTLQDPLPFDAILNIKKSSDASDLKWYIEGYASTSDLDLQDDIIDPEALKAAEGDLLGNSTVLYNHDTNRPIGMVEDSKYQAPGMLWVKVLISSTEPEIWKKITEGVLNKFSIRGTILQAEKRWSNDVNRYVRVIRKMELVEVSLVSLPANPKAKSLRWYMSKALDTIFIQEGGNSMDGIDKLNDGFGISTLEKAGKGNVNELQVGTLKSYPGRTTARKGTIQRDFTDILEAIKRISSGRYSSEICADLASQIVNKMSVVFEDLAETETRLEEFEAEKSLREQNAREEAAKSRTREIAQNIVGSIKEELTVKMSDHESQISEMKNRFSTMEEYTKSQTDSLMQRFEEMQASFVDAMAKSQEQLQALLTPVATPSEQDNLEAGKSNAAVADIETVVEDTTTTEGSEPEVVSVSSEVLEEKKEEEVVQSIETLIEDAITEEFKSAETLEVEVPIVEETVKTENSENNEVIEKSDESSKKTVALSPQEKMQALLEKAWQKRHSK